MKLNDLVQHIPHTGASDAEISAITYDSRKAAAGSLFVCLVGAWLDGHTYAASAYKNGCRAFLCEHALDLPADAAQIITADTRAALAVIGADFYGNPADQLHIIGITGTKGKTPTALLTAAIMPEAGLPCAYIGSNGVDIAGVHEATANTTPESLELHRLFRKMLDANVHHVVLEVSSQALRHNRVDGAANDTKPQSADKHDVQHGVEHGGKRQKFERRFGVTHTFQARRQRVKEKRKRRAQKRDAQINAGTMQNFIGHRQAVQNQRRGGHPKQCHGTAERCAEQQGRSQRFL